MRESHKTWSVVIIVLSTVCGIGVLLSHECVGSDIERSALQKLKSIYVGNHAINNTNENHKSTETKTFKHMRIPPMNRRLEPPPPLKKNFTCMVVMADSIAKSGKFKYPQHLEKTLQEFGYKGTILTNARPGQGITDWLATDLMDVLLSSFNDNNCTAILVQLGLNDGLRGGSVGNALSLQRILISDIRNHVPRDTTIIISTLPVVSSDVLPGSWMNEANIGISEIAIINRCIVADLYRSLMDAFKSSGESNWNKLLADGVHPTPLGVHIISNTFASAVMFGHHHYSVSIFCGDRIYWGGFQFIPKWNVDGCMTNEPIVISLGNGSLIHFITSVEIVVSPSWNTPYARFPEYGKYYIHTTSSTGNVTHTKFQSPMGGPELYWTLPAGTKSVEVTFRKPFPKASNYGNRLLPVLGGGPQPEYPVDPKRDASIIKELTSKDVRFNPLPTPPP